MKIEIRAQANLGAHQFSELTELFTNILCLIRSALHADDVPADSIVRIEVQDQLIIDSAFRVKVVIHFVCPGAGSRALPAYYHKGSGDPIFFKAGSPETLDARDLYESLFYGPLAQIHTATVTA